MLFRIGSIFRRMMSTTPTSHFITLPNRPVVKENGEITEGPLRLHYWQWKGHQPTILICHGGTLHGRCYDLIIKEALSGFHVIALDLRGHGQSQKHPLPYPFPWFGGDVSQFIEMLDLSKNDLMGIGHSMSGHALVLAAAIASKQLFQSLLLLDPAIYSSDIYEIGIKNPEKFEKIAQQKYQWSSVEDMISTMDKPGRLGHWPKDILRDYCTYALDENFKLECTPDAEASVYEISLRKESDIYPIMKDSKFINEIPIEIVRTSLPTTTDDFEASSTAYGLVKWFKKGRDTQLKDVKHLFPMEQPDIAINLVKEFIEEYKNLRSHL